VKDESQLQLSADLLNTYAVLVLIVDPGNSIFQQHHRVNMSMHSSCWKCASSWLDARLRLYCDLQQLAERHVGLMSELERRMEEERDALRREAAAMAASAAAAGEDRARTALSARSHCHIDFCLGPRNVFLPSYSAKAETHTARGVERGLAQSLSRTVLACLGMWVDDAVRAQSSVSLVTLLTGKGIAEQAAAVSCAHPLTTSFIHSVICSFTLSVICFFGHSAVSSSDPPSIHAFIISYLFLNLVTVVNLVSI